MYTFAEMKSVGCDFFFSKNWLNFRKFGLSLKCSYKCFIRRGVYNFCPETKVFEAKTNSRLVLNRFCKNGSRKTFFNTYSYLPHSIHNKRLEIILQLSNKFDKMLYMLNLWYSAGNSASRQNGIINISAFTFIMVATGQQRKKTVQALRKSPSSAGSVCL